MTTPDARLSINQATIKYAPLADALRVTAGSGVGSIGLWRDSVQAVSLPEAGRLLAGSGLRFSSLCRGGFFTVPEGPARRAAMDDNRRAFYVPPYFAHAYQTLTDDTEVMYQVSGSYEPSAERGLRHDDPALGIEWPMPVSVISAKDASWPLIADRDVRDFGWEPETAGAGA